MSFQGVSEGGTKYSSVLTAKSQEKPNISSVQFSSVAQWCLTLCDPMNRSTPGLPVHHQLLEFIRTHVHWVSDAIQWSHPLLTNLLLLPSVFPSISVFFNESVLHIRWPNYWRFSFSISPSKEYSGLISSCVHQDPVMITGLLLSPSATL